MEMKVDKEIGWWGHLNFWGKNINNNIKNPQ